MSTPAVTVSRSLSFGALSTAFFLNLRNLCRVKRLLTLLILFLMPVVLIVVFRTVAIPEIVNRQQEIVRRNQSDESLSVQRSDADLQAVSREMMRAEFISVFWLIAIVAAPLTILLFASGMIRDEQEDQTLTYLLVRPVPRWAIYLTKLLAAICVAWVLTVFGLAATLLTLWAGSGEPPAADAFYRFSWMSLSFLLLIAANGAVFGFLGILLRRSLIIGAIYIAVFEGFLANFPFILRKITAMHYFQCIIRNLIGEQYLKWDSNRSDSIFMWSIAREAVPDTQECVLTLLIVMVVATALGMYVFSTREFRLKTPEGN
jgi:ABC-2 type transport system permease protein